jgi:tryptophan synthase alpha subunit
MAVAALVSAFVIAPVGIGLGIAARRQIRETGEEGDGLALAGIVVGSVITGIYVLMIVLLLATFSVATSYAG